MDIEKIRKLSKKASEGGKLVKAVTAYKSALKNKEQMRDVEMSDYFKTLREPLIEQQKKKTDEKQDKVIEQLHKNQLALTSGIQDIMTLNTELPKITAEEMPDLPTPKEEKVFIANIEKRFHEKDNEIIDELGLIKPSELLKSDTSHLIKYREYVKKN